MRRTDRSLAQSGFDALVIHAGRPPSSFWMTKITLTR